MSQADKSTNRPRRGLAILAGAGPGDEGLVTVATANWLRRAECVVYDRLANPALLKLAPVSAKMIYVGKGPGRHEMTQDQINRVLVEEAAKGRLVVRLKGGDPLIFGRGSEEADALRQAGLAFRFVPGVTSGLAAGAYSGIPLTDRRVGPTLAIVTGHEDPAKGDSAINWKAVAGIDTAIFYMGVGNLPGIAQSLIAAGRSPQTPVAVVHRATTPRQRTVTGTLANIAEVVAAAGIKPPSITIVGDVVAFRSQLSWFEELPLFGQTVLVTRSRTQASVLAAGLAELGAEAIEAPTIDIQPAADFALVDAALGRLGEFQWVVFTSPNGVEAMLDRLMAVGRDSRSLATCKIAAIGPGTAAALAQRGLKADLLPAEFTAEDLGKALAASSAGQKVLLARADIATEQLPQILRQAGAQVEEVAVYRTVIPDALPPEALEALREGRVHWVTFTSSSTADNFVALLKKHGLDIPKSAKLAAIGPVTVRTLESHGLKPTVTASPHTIEALIDAMVAGK